MSALRGEAMHALASYSMDSEEWQISNRLPRQCRRGYSFMSRSSHVTMVGTVQGTFPPQNCGQELYVRTMHSLRGGRAGELK